MLFQSFKYKKNKTEAIIRSPVTVGTFGDLYEYYTNKYYASLDNIENPLIDPVELAAFTDKIDKIRLDEYHRYQSKYKIDDFPI
jgi:hypothetical protein